MTGAAGRNHALPGLRARAWWIAAGYAFFAMLWIYFSDWALALVINDAERIVRWSVYKGLAFVAVTAALLLALIRGAFGTIERSLTALRQRDAERAAHQGEIVRLNGLYAALSQVNGAIVRIVDRDALLREVCRVLVADGRFRMAVIGWTDAGGGAPVPAAAWDDTGGAIDPAASGSSMATAVAIDAGTLTICRDIAAAADDAHWLGLARERGYGAAASLPIRTDSAGNGLLQVYAAAGDAFGDQEIALLNEVAASVAFAVDNLSLAARQQEAEALAASERRFSDAMIESMPGILYLYTEDGRFLRWNRNFETVSGYAGGEIAGMHPLDFFMEPDRELLRQRIAEVFANGESSVEARFLSRDGTTTPYLFTGRRVLLEEQACLIGVGMDISGRVRAEAERRAAERRFRNTLDSMLEGCQIIGHDWRYVYVNEAAARHSRKSANALLGRSMQEVWPDIGESRIFALLERAMRERIAQHEEIRVDFPDGDSGWFDVRCQPVPEGLFVLSIDISERHAAERALQDLNRTLELKVEERTSELADAVERAEAADRLKSSFLATMSHELRTPLNSIIGFTGIMLNGMTGPLTDEQTKQLGMVRGSARHLLDLINDVLDLSKIEAGQLDVRTEKVDLIELIERVVETVQPHADSKGLTLAAEIGAGIDTMTSDRRRVEQILLNLLINGVKFTDRGSVTLAAERDGSRVRFRVTDTGIGIRPEELDLLFAPFRQLDAGLTRRHEGTGLGLAICRRLITLLGGEIRVTSEWQRGTEFTVALPVTAQP